MPLATTRIDAVHETPARRARVAAPDVLRGAALLGIGLVNVPLQAGLDPTSLPVGTLDSLATFAVALLVQGKAFALFSFLFGWSFGTALASAKRRGIPFGRRHARRMLGLAGLGVAHALLVFGGDILVLYALLGAVLWPLRRAATATLLRLAGASVPLAALGFAALAIALDAGLIGSAGDPAATDTFTAAVRRRASEWPSSFAFVLLYNGPLAFGGFCAGLAAARGDFFRAGSVGRRRARAVLPALLGVALVSNALYAIGALGTFGDGLGALLAFASLALAAPSLAALYALAVATLVERGLRAGSVAAAGCLSATGYVAQGALADWIFGAHGLALGGRIGVAGAVFIGLGTGAVVIAGCALWRRRLGRGPLEALLRRVSGA